MPGSNPIPPQLPNSSLHLVVHGVALDQIMTYSLSYMSDKVLGVNLDMQVFLDAWKTAHQAIILAAQAPTYRVTEYAITQLDNKQRQPEHFPEAAGLTGSGLAWGGATQSAAVITLYGTVAGKSGRGRIYLPMPGGSVLATTGRWDTTLLAKLQAVADSLSTSFVTGVGTFRPIVWSRRFIEADDQPVFLPRGSVVTRGVAQTAPGVIRRRRPGVGI